MDLVRGTLRILLPLAFVIALILLSQGVIQSYRSGFTATGLDGQTLTTALAPVASQEAIKELGTNGGGILAANSAHPFENPTPISNIVEILAILLIPRRVDAHVRHHDRQPQAGPDRSRRDDRPVRHPARGDAGRRVRNPGGCRGERRRRDDGRQGSPVRDPGFGVVRRRDHGHEHRRVNSAHDSMSPAREAVPCS